MINNNGYLYYIEKQKQPETTEKRSHETNSTVSRFFSLMLALITLKTDTSIAATRHSAKESNLLTVAAPISQKMTENSQPVPAKAPAAATRNSTPQTQTSTPQNNTKSHSQNSAGFFSRLKQSAWSYAQQLDQDDCAIKGLEDKLNPDELGQSMIVIEQLSLRQYSGHSSFNPFGHGK